MKGSISYLPGEERQAEAWETAIRAADPRVKVRKSDAHPPFKHIYLTTKKPAKPCENRKNA